MMFFAILYTVILILLIAAGLPSRDGASRFPAWSGGALLWILLAIIGWVLFRDVIN